MRRILAALVVAWLACCSPTSLIAQGTLSTILTNGPTARRLNIVVLAEGYTTNQQTQFLSDATNAVTSLLAQPPYGEYESYFNAFAIFVASVNSGSDHPYSGNLKDTYFNSTYDSYDFQQLITIPPNRWTNSSTSIGYGDTNYNNGQGKVNALLQSLMPEYDLVLMVVNDTQYGGSGDSSSIPTLITSLNSFFAEVLAHESGHALGGLADEYSDPFPGFVPVEKPNATAQTNRALVKWTAWIATNTPLPTPQDNTNAGVVGVFKGAEYQTSGWYRPKLDCKMHTVGANTNFCEVCSEQLVKSIYVPIRPIDAFSPGSTNFTIYSTQPVSFSVTPMQPMTHDLSIQWFTNNVAVVGASNTDFQLAPKLLGNGNHTLKAVVLDPTPLVRNDPTNRLKATNTWSLTLSLNELSLISTRYLSSNRFRLTVTGTAPQGFVIQGSTNLTNWLPLSTNTLAGGKFDYTNSNLTNLTWRYYRTVSPP